MPPSGGRGICPLTQGISAHPKSPKFGGLTVILDAANYAPFFPQDCRAALKDTASRRGRNHVSNQQRHFLKRRAIVLPLHSLSSD